MLTATLRASLVLLTLVFVIGCQSKPVLATEVKPVGGASLQDPPRPDAPEFPADLQWLNTGRPLTMKELRGKVVLLDFWTYCCINCMHIIPDLKRLEAKYAKELVVIGVHSAKFLNERDTSNIREAVLRYEVEHPVVNDHKMDIWRTYGVNSWPTLVLIDPGGKVVGGMSGEGIYDVFDRAISETVAKFSGKINRSEIKLTPEKNTLPASVISFPGKLALDAAGGRLFISDSNNNRIVSLTTGGKVLEVIGEGSIGLKDGGFGAAQFFRPQGLTYDPAGDLLYVADTENHAVRVVNLKAKTVTTLAGTGKQAPFPVRGGFGKNTPLSSPWDVKLAGKILYVAMAGTHQLWRIDLETKHSAPYAGSGRENVVDGPLMSAQLAQPSGLALDGKKLYFADSEVSAIREADLTSGGAVRTLIGEGLFEFGDVDGKKPTARLQHPLGVAFANGALFVADTYNHRIKRYDFVRKEVVAFAGSGKRGMADGDGDKASFNEPAGLVALGDKLFVADTNNHLIRVVNLQTKQVSTLKLSGLEKLARRVESSGPAAKATRLDPIRVAPTTSTIQLQIKLPAGTKLNPEAPFSLKVGSAKPGAITLTTTSFTKPALIVDIPIQVKEAGDVTLDFVVNYCNEGNEGLCYFKDVHLVVALNPDPAGEASPRIAYTVVGK